MDNNVWALMRYLREDDTFTAAGAARDTPVKGFPAAAGVSEMPAKGLLPAGAPAADTSAETGAGAGWPPLLALKIFLFLSCKSSARVKPSPGSCSRTQWSLLAFSRCTQNILADSHCSTWRLGRKRCRHCLASLHCLEDLLLSSAHAAPPLGTGSTQSDLGRGPRLIVWKPSVSFRLSGAIASVEASVSTGSPPRLAKIAYLFQSCVLLAHDALKRLGLAWK